MEATRNFIASPSSLIKGTTSGRGRHATQEPQSPLFRDGLAIASLFPPPCDLPEPFGETPPSLYSLIHERIPTLPSPITDHELPRAPVSVQHSHPVRHDADTRAQQANDQPAASAERVPPCVPHRVPTATIASVHALLPALLPTLLLPTILLPTTLPRVPSRTITHRQQQFPHRTTTNEPVPANALLDVFAHGAARLQPPRHAVLRSVLDRRRV